MQCVHSLISKGRATVYYFVEELCLVARQDVCLQMNATSSLSPSFIQFLCAF